MKNNTKENATETATDQLEQTIPTINEGGFARTKSRQGKEKIFQADEEGNLTEHITFSGTSIRENFNDFSGIKGNRKFSHGNNEENLNEQFESTQTSIEKDFSDSHKINIAEKEFARVVSYDEEKQTAIIEIHFENGIELRELTPRFTKLLDKKCSLEEGTEFYFTTRETENAEISIGFEPYYPEYDPETENLFSEYEKLFE